jgi:hypothetical protein
MTIFPALLMLHLIALVLVAGTSIIEFVHYRTFWTLLPDQQEKAVGILGATIKSSKLGGIGGGLLIVTGVGMIALTHGVMAEQAWFKIKMAFVLLLLVNGAIGGKRHVIKLAKITSMNTPDVLEQALKLRGKMRTFFIIQLGILLVIIFLSAYKFN